MVVGQPFTPHPLLAGAIERTFCDSRNESRFVFSFFFIFFFFRFLRYLFSLGRADPTLWAPNNIALYLPEVRESFILTSLRNYVITSSRHYFITLLRNHVMPHAGTALYLPARRWLIPNRLEIGENVFRARVTIWCGRPTASRCAFSQRFAGGAASNSTSPPPPFFSCWRRCPERATTSSAPWCAALPLNRVTAHDIRH